MARATAIIAIDRHAPAPDPAGLFHLEGSNIADGGTEGNRGVNNVMTSS